MWHHQHIIEAIEGVVLMTDIVDYQPPIGFLGAIANQLIIKKQLNDIFTFRTKKLEEHFGKIGQISNRIASTFKYKLFLLIYCQ